MNDIIDRPARPWDLFDNDIGRVEEEVAVARLSLCKACDRYFAPMHMCKECGCIMNMKVKLPNAACPLGKWAAVKAAPAKEE